MEDRQILLQRKLHEESLPTQRLTVFLLTSSILFLGFAGLKDLEPLNKVVSTVGMITCLVSVLHGWHAKKDMDKLDEMLGEGELGSRKWIRGRTILVWQGLLIFGSIWGFSIWFSFCH